jgi:selenide,water dikinase
MLRSNADAASVALEAGATSATDVTGFGLLGHLGRMAIASGVDAVLTAAEVPSLPGARELAKAGLLPGGSVRNRRWVEQEVLDPRSAVDPGTLAFLCDAQTSGGLLFGVAGHDAAEVAAERLRADGHDAAVIGHATKGTGRITVAA